MTTEFWKGRKHKPTTHDKTRVMVFGNGQHVVTIPKHVAVWKGITKGTLVKWSDAGAGRVLVEIIPQEIQ